jgi:hypothetical protein
MMDSLTDSPSNSDARLIDLVRATGVDGGIADGLQGIAEQLASIENVAAGAVFVWSDERLYLVGESDHRSTHSMRFLDLTQRGPCIAACRDGRIVTVTSRDGSESITDIAALPMAFRGAVVGSLALLGTGRLESSAITRAGVMADIAAVMLAAGDPAPDGIARLRAIRAAIDGRTVIEQAKGMLAERYGVSPEEAWNRLSRSSSTTGLRVGHIARQIVERNLPQDVEDRLATRSLESAERVTESDRDRHDE